MGIYGYPGSVQLIALALGLLGILLALLRGPLRRFLPWVDRSAAARALGLGSLIFGVVIILTIALESTGLINVDPGGWLLLVAGGLMALGGAALPPTEPEDPLRTQYGSTTEILIFVVLLAAGLAVVAYALDVEDGGSFVALLTGLAAAGAALGRGGFFQYLAVAAARQRTVLTLGAVAVAFLFPFTQGGSDANMSIATQVLIFATTAMGLNIVVGLAGLLDLGYIAFLGAGAYVGATMSYSAFATIDWKPPFFVVMVIGGMVSATLGLIIGSPTLRVSGDYLAIVTLAFGEIFRLAMNNLDGENGP